MNSHAPSYHEYRFRLDIISLTFSEPSARTAPCW